MSDKEPIPKTCPDCGSTRLERNISSIRCYYCGITLDIGIVVKGTWYREWKGEKIYHTDDRWIQFGWNPNLNLGDGE